MVDAIARACADAHAPAHARPGANLGKVTAMGKGQGDVPAVRREAIVRSVQFSLSLSLSLLVLSCLT